MLKKSLLEEGQLLQRIVRAHADNDQHVKKPKTARKGYMGHLRLMSIAVVKSAKVFAARAHIHTHTFLFARTLTLTLTLSLSQTHTHSLAGTPPHVDGHGVMVKSSSGHLANRTLAL